MESLNYYDAIVILGGGLVKDGNLWRTNQFDEGDNFAPTGDTIRVIAGSYLFKNELTKCIIASGGKGQYKDTTETPTIASVIKKELIALGISPDYIEEEGGSNNSYQQLRLLNVIIKHRDWNSVGIISNEYHLPRIKAMLEFAPRLGKLNEMVELISAEKVLLKYAPEIWREKIEEAYNGDGMKKRMAIEHKGTLDIREGRYKFS